MQWLVSGLDMIHVRTGLGINRNSDSFLDGAR